MSSLSTPPTLAPAKRFVQAGPHRVCYVEGGEPASGNTADSKPRLLLVHGWIASHQLYRKCWGGIAEMAHYRALDLVGFGDSDKPDPTTTPYDPGWYGEQIAAFLDATGWSKVTLCAQSMGAIAAVEFARRFPERVEKLIVLDGACVPVPPPVLGRILQAPVLGGVLFDLLGGTRKSISDFLKNDVYYVKSVFDPAVVDDMLRVMNSPGGKKAAYATMMRMVAPSSLARFTPRLAELKVPVRLLWGEHDKLYPVDRCAREMQRLIPGSTLDVITGAGHEPPVEAPEAFLRSLRTALHA
jgi:pimeloyl-ACP methyl ester carboxylesterase